MNRYCRNILHALGLSYVCCLVLGSLSSPVASAGEPAFSVMSWNLEWFFDDSKQGNLSALAKEKSAPNRESWDWRRDAVAASIAEVRPSIVALQEIEGPQVLWYLARAIDREHALTYADHAIEGNDRYTEQDVGLLTTRPAEVVSLLTGSLTERMRREGVYAPVPKHLAAIMEIPVNGQTETILVVNLHLRSGAAEADTRAMQAASVNRWIALWQSPTTHLIVLGDFNTDASAGRIPAGSEMSAFITRGTTDPADDLVDLLERVPNAGRQTHMIRGKQFDRILVSQSLVDDDPDRLDLCLRSVVVRPDLSIRGGVDVVDQHWNHYWDIDAASRDLSDHYPLIAEFEIR